MFRFAAEAEEKAKDLQTRIVRLSKKVTDTKINMAKIVKAKGQDAQLDDVYPYKSPFKAFEDGLIEGLKLIKDYGNTKI